MRSSRSRWRGPREGRARDRGPWAVNVDDHRVRRSFFAVRHAGCDSFPEVSSGRSFEVEPGDEHLPVAGAGQLRLRLPCKPCDESHRGPRKRHTVPNAQKSAREAFVEIFGRVDSSRSCAAANWRRSRPSSALHVAVELDLRQDPSGSSGPARMSKDHGPTPKEACRLRAATLTGQIEFTESQYLGRTPKRVEIQPFASAHVSAIWRSISSGTCSS